MSAATTEIATAIEMVSARSPNSWPSTSFRNNTGTNTATVVAVEASSAPATWRAPVLVASSSGIPPSRSRTTLPETTIAPSTTMPTANASPASEMTFRLRPQRSSTTKVAHRHTGMVAAISSVTRHSRMNHHTTSSASSAPTTRFSVSSRTARRMNSDASKDCSMPSPWAVSGPARSSATAALTASSVASTLAPLARSTRMPIAGLPFW